jgi:hypothetical protein
MTNKAVSELEGAELDYWVAQHDPMCDGLVFERRDSHYVGINKDNDEVCVVIPEKPGFVSRIRMRNKYPDVEFYDPSKNWNQGGPIIEREGISLMYRIGKEGVCNPYYHAQVGPEEPENHTLMTDENPLVAAMRSFVASKFGDYVELPNND